MLKGQGSERHQASAISGIRIGGLLAQVSGSIDYILGGRDLLEVTLLGRIVRRSRGEILGEQDEGGLRS